MENPNSENIREISETLDETLDKYIKAGLDKGDIRLCPHCKEPGELASGCNYIKCPMPGCQKEWCWLCGNPKYNPAAGLPACNDRTHNSH